MRGNMLGFVSAALQSTLTMSRSLFLAPAAFLLLAVRPTVCLSCFAPLFSIKMAHRCQRGLILERADYRCVDKREQQREH